MGETTVDYAAYVRHVANNVLWNGVGDYYAGLNYKYSCAALCNSLYAIDHLSVSNRCVLRAKLHAIEPDLPDRLCTFNEFREGPKRQGARYLWLMWFALMIEEGVI